MSEKKEKKDWFVIQDKGDHAVSGYASEDEVKKALGIDDEEETADSNSGCAFAVIETGGKQYKVSNGDVIFVEKLDAEDGAKVEFDVVALSTDGGIKTGAPYIDGAKVTGEVLKTGKAKKIYVSTYKPKKGEKRKIGHRQPYTKVEIKSIG